MKTDNNYNTNCNNQNGVYFAPQQNNLQYQQPAQPQGVNVQGGYYMPPYTPLKKEYKPFEKNDTLFFILTLITSFLLVDFAFFNGFKLGFTVAYYVLFALTTAYLYRRKNKISVFPLLCGALSLTGAATFTLYNNTLINTIMLFLVLGLYCIYVLGISVGFSHRSGSFKMLIDLAESVVIDTFGGVENVVGSAGASSKKNKKPLYILIGVAVSLPFLAVIIPLLAKSDAAFEALIGKIVLNIGKYVLEIVISVIACPFIFSYLFNKRSDKKPKRTAKSGNAQVIASPITVSFLSMISVTYCVYLLSQLAYFFSAFNGILPDDYEYTASAFARRGFYEMFAVCVINVGLIIAAGVLTKRTGKKLSPAVKGLSCFISLFSGVLIVTVMQKMKLNISIYGLSVNRVLVTTLMIMIFIMLAFFILHIFAPKISYMQPIIIVCSAIFIALSFADSDALCARYNINAYKSGAIESLDTENIRMSSDSALPYLIELANDSDRVIANRAMHEFVQYVFYSSDITFSDNKAKLVIDGSNNDLRSYNLARVNAYKKAAEFYDNADKNSKETMQKDIWLIENCYYDEYENAYFDYSHGDHSVVYRYNPKTGNYDIVENDYENY
ncbi:MAG: DUF4173 domain-containing protein [Ruminococcaceae bacterium]|nr:DUF4173 domain-containing protein [Oscillospiraceae bacterium]